jgi:uncharacterized small protein (DUF1192 family)
MTPDLQRIKDFTEMKALREEIEKLKADLAREKEDRQFDNMVHQKELKDLTKK